MTISSTNTKNSYSGDGSTVAFSYTFKILDDDDIQVILRTDATGTETVQTKTTHYSVSGVGNAGGGTITFVSAPATGETVVLLRNVPLTQTTDYTPNDPFPAATHEDALDKLTLMAQDTQEEVDRSIKLSRTNTMTSTEFTVGATARANKIFAFDSSGELAVTQEIGTFQGDWAASTAYAERDLVKDTSTNNIFIVNSAHTSSGSQPLTTNTNSSKYDLIVDAASATTSATNAATSATAAATSATAAANSATAAATSESNAAGSEASVAADAAAAAASAASASTSESNASTSETNAATSASAAATSATNAATSATSASNSASAAGTSETNAATSATNAANSAAAASTSASNAATSESNAATSETNASTSASSASTSASAAAASAAAAAASFDAFDDIYLGAKASAPTVDNDGDALTEGDQYFNTTNNTLFVWNGSAWQAASPDIVGDTTPQLGGNLDTNGNDINFGDNDKATFGDAVGGDLQIYHDGSNSYIQDAGTGNLIVKATDLRIRANNDHNFIVAAQGGGVDIYNNNQIKLTTTSGGIDVTGNINVGDNHTIGDDVNDNLTISSSSGEFVIIEGDGGFLLRQGASATNAIRVASGGDISFYDSAGSSQSLFWDADQQRLGLGTTSPSKVLDVRDNDATGTTTSSNRVALFATNGTGKDAHITFSNLVDDPASIGNRGALYFDYNNTERMRIDSSGNVGIGTTSPTAALHIVSGSDNANTLLLADTLTDSTIVDGFVTSRHATSAEEPVLMIQGRSTGADNIVLIGGTHNTTTYNTATSIQFYTASSDTSTTPSERMRIDSSGNLLVGKTVTSLSTDGIRLKGNDTANFVVNGGAVLDLNRRTSGGSIVNFYKDGSTAGAIGTVNVSSGERLTIGNSNTKLRFNNGADEITPCNNDGANRDNAIDLGDAGARFDDIFATNGTIQTSDQNEKEQIASLTTAEITAAKAISKLFKTFKWQDKVAAKGDAARKHAGVIAQEVQTAMTDAGLDAADYAFWCSDTWTNDDGTSQTRLGIRYPELLAFIGAATEQRLADIETRLTALEGA